MWRISRVLRSTAKLHMMAEAVAVAPLRVKAVLGTMEFGRGGVEEEQVCMHLHDALNVNFKSVSYHRLRDLF